jgi:hypothetical protein
VERLLESDAGKKALNRAALALLEDSDALDETAEDGVLKMLKEGVGSYQDGLLALSRCEARINRAKIANKQDPSHPAWMRTSINLVKTVSNRSGDVRAAIFFTSDDDRMKLLSQLTVTDMQKLVTACNASKDPEKAGQSVAKALVRLADERDTNAKASATKESEAKRDSMARGVRHDIVAALQEEAREELEQEAEEAEQAEMDEEEKLKEKQEEEYQRLPLKHVDLNGRVVLARIGHILDYGLHRRNVSVDKVLSVLSGYTQSELVELENELQIGKREVICKTLKNLLQMKMKKKPVEEDRNTVTQGRRKTAGQLITEAQGKQLASEHSLMKSMAHGVTEMLEKVEDKIEDITGHDGEKDDGKFLSDEDAGNLVDAFERVLDEGILDEEQLIEFVYDLTSAAVLALLETCRPSDFWERFRQDILGFDRRDSLGLQEDSAAALCAACVQLPKFRVIEVCEIVAQEQEEGAESLKRLTGIMERVDLFVSNQAYVNRHNLQIGRNYLMLMLEMRTLSAQAVHTVVKDLPVDEIKLWLKDLYGKDAIDLHRDEGSGEGDRLFGLFRRRGEKVSLARALWNALEDCFPIWLIGIYTIWPIITERMLYVMKCTMLMKEDGTRAEFWDYDFNVVCFDKGVNWPDPDSSTGKFTPALIASAGLIIWSFGSIAFLVFKIKATGPENRFNDENMRRFGYFYQGFEPQYWYWEIGWKRFDFLIVSFVTYTSLVPDPRAKVIIYVMLGGVAMAAHMFCQPYDDRMHGLLDRSETMALLVRFNTFGAVATLLLAGGSMQVILFFMTIVVLGNLIYLLYITFHIVSEVTKNVFTPNVDDVDGDADMKAKMEEARKNMTLGRKILLAMFGPTLVSFHRQRALGEKHAVHLVWQGPMRNARFGKLPPPQQSIPANMMRQFILVLFSLHDDSEVGLISKNCSDFWDYMMGMPSEVPAHGMDILILLVLANNKILDAGDEPSGANLIARSETILKNWLDANGDKAGRCNSAPAIPPRTVFIHGINLEESISSEQIVRFLVGFWRLPYAIALHVIHTLDVRLSQLQTHQVLPDEQIILKAFQTAVEKQREQGAAVGKHYLEVTGGVLDTTLWTDPLLKPFAPEAKLQQESAGDGAGADEIDIHFDNFDFLDKQAKGSVEGDAAAGSWLQYMPAWMGGASVPASGGGDKSSPRGPTVCDERPQDESKLEIHEEVAATEMRPPATSNIIHQDSKWEV